MKQLGLITPERRENPLGDLIPIKSFLQDLAAAILADANQYEGVWKITNRVYDRWMCDPLAAPGKTSQRNSGQDLALSA